jgi:HEAT repeat protein
MGLVRRKSEAAGRPPEASGAGRLDDPDPEVRRAAALAFDGAIEALLDRIAAESEPAVRDAMLTTLAAHDVAEVAAGLSAHLGSDDPGLRTAAAEALATMPVSVPAIVPQLLQDPDHDVRVLTAMILADLPHPRSQTWLAQMIRHDPHPNVVAAAIDALLPSLGPEHHDLLEQAVRRFPADPFLRFVVEAALR